MTDSFKGKRVHGDREKWGGDFHLFSIQYEYDKTMGKGARIVLKHTQSLFFNILLTTLEELAQGTSRKPAL